MRVWIDLANSPHVLFFAPIAREMVSRGVETLFTARDFAQTLGLAALHGLEVLPVGVHGGAGTIGKSWAIFSRARALREFALRCRPDIAISHNSYAQVLAARSAGIRTVTLMDYEHTPANHISFRLAHRIVLPSAIPLEAVSRYGARASKVVFYDGFKEQVYLDDFEPERSKLASALPTDLWDRYVVAIARPPAEFAIYHRFENPLFEAWLRRVGVEPAVRVIVLPRTPPQKQAVRDLRLPSVLLPDAPLDGLNLLYHSDLVVSAGGTMSREAAVLGVPAYSLFRGKAAAVDIALERLGRLTRLHDESDLSKIRLEKRGEPSPLRNAGLARRLVELAGC